MSDHAATTSSTAPVDASAVTAEPATGAPLGARSSASSFAGGGTAGPTAPGSLGALSPSWYEPEDGSEPEPWLTADEAFERFLGWCNVRGIELWPHQEEAPAEL